MRRRQWATLCGNGRWAVSVGAIGLRWGIVVVRGACSRGILFKNWTSSKTLESVLLTKVRRRPRYRRCALNGAVVAVWVAIGIALAAVRSVGIHSVSRLLVALLGIHVVPIASVVIAVAVAIPSWVGLHAAVPCSGRSSNGPNWTALAVAIVHITISSGLPIAIVAADLGEAVLVIGT